jgi:hypothetical protein
MVDYQVYLRKKKEKEQMRDVDSLPKPEVPAKTIWKYPLELQDEQMIEVPVNSEYLHVALQDGVITLWVLVNPTYPKVGKIISIFGTGRTVSVCYKKSQHIGTIFQGVFVWHIFDGSVD